MSIWACPHCAGALTRADTLWQCTLGHRFDQAKEGYVNLLPAHHKRSKQPGDSGDMVMARRRVHEAELYRPLAKQITQILADDTPGTILLDIGCGEGYYNGFIAERLPSIALYGVDIAKPAVRLAAKHYTQNYYAVASVSQLPVLDQSVDWVTQVFAPCADEEVLRVLGNDGKYLQVGPSPRHLWQLRCALYDQPQAHSPLRKTLPGATLINEGEMQYTLTLNNTQLIDLLMATPFAYRGHREKRARLQTLEKLELTMAFAWRVFQKDALQGERTNDQ